MSDSWERVIGNAELSSVAVQAFSGPKLVRAGTGTILSADGLIITTADVTPSLSAVYQVSIGDQIVRADVVLRDFKKNLSLLKVGDLADSATARISDTTSPTVGQECVLVGATTELSRNAFFAQRGMVSAILTTYNAIDTQFVPYLSGSQVIDRQGRTVGIAYLRNGRVFFVDGKTIGAFVSAYLQSLAK